MYSHKNAINVSLFIFRYIDTAEYIHRVYLSKFNTNAQLSQK